MDKNLTKQMNLSKKKFNKYNTCKIIKCTKFVKKINDSFKNEDTLSFIKIGFFIPVEINVNFINYSVNVWKSTKIFFFIYLQLVRMVSLVINF